MAYEIFRRAVGGLCDIVEIFEIVPEGSGASSNTAGNETHTKGDMACVNIVAN